MKRNRIPLIILGSTAWVALSAGPGCRAHDETCPSHTADAPAPRPIIGAIRWDGWQPTEPTGNRSVGLLAPPQWRYRLPFYAIEVDSNTVVLAAKAQSVMDQEIEFASAAGLDFFCFNHYLSELRASLDLYLSSTRKGDINFCLQMGSLIPARVADAVNLMSTEPTYQKVAGGRPLVFLQAWYLAGYDPPTPRSAVDEFRARVMEAGLPNPYIVVQHFTAAAAAAEAEKYGADAISSYAKGLGSGESGRDQPFAELAEGAERDWDAYKNTGRKVVPTVMTGWDPRADPERADEPYWSEAKPHEIATHLRNAVRWVRANPCVAEANTIQIYAWNEIAEGGWLLPSLEAADSAATSRLDAIADVPR